MKLPSPLIPSKSNTAINPSSSSSVFPKFLHRPTPAQLNDLLNAASRTKNASHVAQIPARIITTGVCPKQFTFSAVLPACAETAVSAHGERVHCLVIRHGFGRDVLVGSALVDMYAKRSRADAVEKVFDEMSERNPVTWSSMVLGLLQNRFFDRAVLVFREVLRGDSVVPDEVIVSGGLSACANNGSLQFGRQVHGLVVKQNFILS